MIMKKLESILSDMGKEISASDTATQALRPELQNLLRAHDKRNEDEMFVYEISLGYAIRELLSSHKSTQVLADTIDNHNIVIKESPINTSPFMEANEPFSGEYRVDVYVVDMFEDRFGMVSYPAIIRRYPVDKGTELEIEIIPESSIVIAPSGILQTSNDKYVGLFFGNDIIKYENNEEEEM